MVFVLDYVIVRETLSSLNHNSIINLAKLYKYIFVKIYAIDQK